MFEKITEILGVGTTGTAALIREVVCGNEDQKVLFEPENAKVLQVYVECGHSFSPSCFLTFLKVAEKSLVKTYLEMGFELSDMEKSAVLELKDDELIQTMIDSGSWAPFPFGSGVHPLVNPQVLELHEYELGGVASA